MNGTSLDIPDFLLVKNRQPLTPAQQERLKVIMATRTAERDKFDYNKPRTWSPEAEAMFQQQEAEKHRHTMARINALRIRNGQDPIKERKSRTPKSGKGKGTSKTQLIASLLTRPGGCTTKDVLEATGWPTVSMPAQAKVAGLVLVKTKTDGVTRYSAKGK